MLQVLRLLTPMYAIGFDQPPTGNLDANVTSDAHNALARQLAEDSITLLKNDGGLLPLSLDGLKSIAVFGDIDTVAGGGSGGVQLPYVVTPFEGIYRCALSRFAWCASLSVARKEVDPSSP